MAQWGLRGGLCSRRTMKRPHHPQSLHPSATSVVALCVDARSPSYQRTQSIHLPTHILRLILDSVHLHFCPIVLLLVLLCLLSIMPAYRWSYGCSHLDTTGTTPLARGTGWNHTFLICEPLGDTDEPCREMHLGSSSARTAINTKPHTSQPRLGKHLIHDYTGVNWEEMLDSMRQQFDGGVYVLGSRDCWTMVRAGCGRLGVSWRSVGGPINGSNPTNVARSLIDSVIGTGIPGVNIPTIKLKW